MHDVEPGWLSHPASPHLEADNDDVLAAFDGTPPPSVMSVWAIRAVAHAVDLLLIFLSTSATGFLLGWLLGRILTASGFTLEMPATPHRLATLVAGFVLTTVYFVAFESLCGATVGKTLLRRRVVQSDGGACRPSAALKRALLRWVDGLFFGVIAYAEMKRSPLRQRLGDRWAGTVVVQSRDPLIRHERSPRPLHAAVLFVGTSLVIGMTLLWTSAPIVPSDEAYQQMPVERLNLSAADLGASFTLRAEAPLALSNNAVRETSERMFSAPATAVKSRVLVFKKYLTDTPASLTRLSEQWARNEIKTAEEFRPMRLLCTDRASFESFSNGRGTAEGYVVALVKRNVLVSLLSFGKPGDVRPAGVAEWACTIFNRVH